MKLNVKSNEINVKLYEEKKEVGGGVTRSQSIGSDVLPFQTRAKTWRTCAHLSTVGN